MNSSSEGTKASLFYFLGGPLQAKPPVNPQIVEPPQRKSSLSNYGNSYVLEKNIKSSELVGDAKKLEL